MMNAAWVRFLKSAYRREPIISFMITIGVVDAAIGGFGDRPSLLTFGIGTAGLAIALRWWMLQRRSVEVPYETPQYYLPPNPSRPPIPSLNVSKKHPPQQ